MNNAINNQGFWQRQFSANVTRQQMIFDVIMGIFAPLLCIILDPVVFNELLSSSLKLAYIIIGLEIVTLALWLIFGTHLKLFAGFIGGILLSGALFALVIGIFLLPLSFLGLIFIIGILGFTPFLTAFVFFRNGVRVLEQANEKKISVTSLIMGISLVVAIQGGIQWYKIISESKHSPTSTDNFISSAQLKSWCTDTYLDEIVLIYGKETEPATKKTIAKLYQKLTGKDIEDRLWVLSD
jgi:hypothetical protein